MNDTQTEILYLFMKLGSLDVIRNLNCEFENDYNANMPGLLFTELKL